VLRGWQQDVGVAGGSGVPLSEVVKRLEWLGCHRRQWGWECPTGHWGLSVRWRKGVHGALEVPAWL